VCQGNLIAVAVASSALELFSALLQLVFYFAVSPDSIYNITVLLFGRFVFKLSAREAGITRGSRKNDIPEFT